MTRAAASWAGAYGQQLPVFNTDSLRGIDWRESPYAHTLGRNAPGDGGGGVWWFDPTDLTAGVTRDPQHGVFIPPAGDATGASGAWVRLYDGPLRPQWFGAMGAGADDGAALQACLDYAASLATDGAYQRVELGAGDYGTTQTINVPNKVLVSGAGRGTRLRALAGFTATAVDTTVNGAAATVRPLVTLAEEGTTAAYTCGLSWLTVYGSDLADLGVFSRRINEQSGLQHVLVSRCGDGVLITSSVASGNPAQNYHLRDLEVILSATATAANYGVKIDGYGTDLRGLGDLTVTVAAQTSTAATALLLDGVTGVVDRVHAENVAVGVEIGAHQACIGLDVHGVTGASDLTHTVRINGATSSYAVALSAIRAKGATHTITDDVNGRQHDDAAVAFYSTDYSYLAPAARLAIPNGTTTPDVSGLGQGGTASTSNTAPTTITNLTGFDGQQVTLRLDANTTVQHSSAAIRLSGGVDFVASAGDTLSLVKVGATNWYETARSVNG